MQKTLMSFSIVATIAGAVLCAGSDVPGGSTPAGPVAIGMRDTGQAAVLMSDGRVSSIDIASGKLGPDIYRVPGIFDAVDIAGGRTKAGPVICLTLNPHSSGGPSYILQVFGDKREVWAYLMAQGIYVGLAMDAEAGVAYATNSSNNVVYRVQIGQQKGGVREIATVAGAERIGAVAVDPAGRRLFVSDLGQPRVHVVPLQGKDIRTIELQGSYDVRALAWSAADKRLYMADSGRETIWSVDPATSNVQPAMKDVRFKAPAGLAFAADGSLWMVDEGAITAFQLSTSTRKIVRAVSWTDAPRTRRF